MKKETIEQEETHNIELLHESEDVRSFKLSVNGEKFIDNDYILKVRLPQFGLLNHINCQQMIGDSSIIITLDHGPGVAKSLMESTQRTLDDFNIEFLLNDKTYSTWKLHEATICGVSLGEVSKIGHENPNLAFIECEVMFKSLDIDGIIL